MKYIIAYLFMFNSRKILDHLLKITMQSKSVSPDSFKELKHGWIKEGILVELDDADIEEKKMLIQEIYQDLFIKNNFPVVYIEDQINRLISLSFKLPLEKRPEFFKKEIEKFREDLKENIKEWIIIVPIDNFKLEKEWSIGNVVFYPSDNKKNFDKITHLWEVALKESPHYTAEEKKAFIDQQLELLRKSFNGVTVTFAEVKTRGIIEIAQMEAMTKIRMSLNIARLYNLPYDDSHREYFGISGEIIRANIRYTMRHEAETNNLNPIFERIGFIIPFEFTEKRLQFMKDNGYKDLESIFAAEKQTDFEKRLLTTIYWYGEAINTEMYFDSKEDLESKSDFKHLQYFNLNQKFLKLMIALESILLFDENEPITNNVAERTAFLLSSKFEERKKIKRIIKELYSTRSSIVHHGKSSLSLMDLDQLSWIVQNTIFNLIKLIKKIPLNEKRDLQEYLEKLKLS